MVVKVAAFDVFQIKMRALEGKNKQVMITGIESWKGVVVYKEGRRRKVRVEVSSVNVSVVFFRRLISTVLSFVSYGEKKKKE